MTCFWTGILNAFTIEEIKAKVCTPLGASSGGTTWTHPRKPNVEYFINALISRANEVDNEVEDTIEVVVLWNGEQLTKQQLKENMEHITSFDIKSIHRGYDCSCCDPFLILISKLFEVNIYHTYNGVLIKYECYVAPAPPAPPAPPAVPPRAIYAQRTIKFTSNNKHFWNG